MSDFSSYGGPSAEWTALAAQLPPPPAAPRSVAELKSEINADREQRAREAMQALSSSVAMADYSIPTRDGKSIEGRAYRARNNGHDGGRPLPVYVHLHGGGFAFGTLASEDAICARMAIATGVIVLNVNYRHTPEATYPTAWQDAHDALVWLHRNINELGGDPAQVVMGGISAGAQITASLVLQKHLEAGKDPVSSAPSFPQVVGQVLMIPCLVNVDAYGPQLARLRDPKLSSYVENEHAPILPVARIRAFMDLLQISKPVDPADLALNPGNASVDQVCGLPPTVLGICGLDPLRDEGLLFGELLTKAGVPNETYLFRGVPHGYRRFGDKLPSASAHWDKVMHEGIQWVLKCPQARKDFAIHDLK
ncbi:Alpha/Beta hydrolase protein [Microdochium bolleyi]|uniref:Alpha/Beta hydrolase protein n=1 Tax=Microdochium bolleyi TaxID=196109 RepID=A0A136ITW2_9PEZI|nr:Alpha/Beta hydrolase protein [Microdochium bolleyi]